jgi:hypothetical protein
MVCQEDQYSLNLRDIPRFTKETHPFFGAGITVQATGTTCESSSIPR